jgi:protein SCO1/2
MTMNRQRPTRGHLPLFAIVASTLAAVLAAGCGGGGGAQSAPRGQSATESSRYAGLLAKPAKPAPALRLRDYRGRPIDLKQYRGDAVLVTFIYTHCPDTCPLIVSNMKTAQALLGARADKLQIVAVSTDPQGDTPKTVRSFLDAHGMSGRMEFLIGSKQALGRVWKDWNIVAKPASSGRDLVEHSALIYGIDAEGKITTLYPANFRPAQLVHDVPLLEAR